MTLGERIARFRKAKSLSQEELANILNISRQAVYKWESDQTTPELEKLTALSSIFEVSLDELVKGEKPRTQEPSAQTEPKRDKHFSCGILFLACGILSTLILVLLSRSMAGAIAGIPFIVCAVLCFFTRRHTTLWCGWTFFICIDLYMRYASGVMPSHILLSFIWTQEMNYARLAFAWIQFLTLLIMIAVTANAFALSPQERSKKTFGRLALQVLAWAALFFVGRMGMLQGLGASRRMLRPLLEEGYSVLLASVAVFAVRTAMGLRKK